MVLSHAAAHVELTLLGQSRQYRRGQAQLRLKQFFEEYPPEAVVWTTEESSSTDWFAAGRYHVWPAGQALRLYAHWRKRGTGWELVTLHVFRSDQS